VPRAVAWYRDVLGLERRHEQAWGDAPAVMAAGTTSIALFPLRAEPPNAGRGNESPATSVPSALHVAFRADRARFLAAQSTLRSLGIAFEFQDHGIAHSIYFRDPDGHALEITTYDVEKPDAREAVEVLLKDGHTRIERIVSRGHASPDGFWYDQDEAEFVVLVRGAARLEFDGGRLLELRPGDTVHLAAHERHRVAWTDPSKETVWIAVFHRPAS
jgi:cupin 2 domain-containing protein